MISLKCHRVFPPFRGKVYKKIPHFRCGGVYDYAYPDRETTVNKFLLVEFGSDYIKYAAIDSLKGGSVEPEDGFPDPDFYKQNNPNFYGRIYLGCPGDYDCDDFPDAEDPTPDIADGTKCYPGSTDVPKDECVALRSLYQNMNGANWSDSDSNGWNKNQSLCTWAGVTCSDGPDRHVTEIVRVDKNLNGGFFSNSNWRNLLPELERLDLSHNTLRGEIPDSFKNLTNLTYLNLGYNQLGQDYALMGGIPSSIGNLTQLEHLYLNNNRLQGSLPSEFGRLTNLKTLHLHNQGGNWNELSGSLPMGLTHLTALESLRFNNTNLCEPPYPAFQDWLAGIDEKASTGVQCDVCASVTQIPQSECAALIKLYENTDGSNRPPAEREALGSPPEGGKIPGKPRWG